MIAWAKEKKENYGGADMTEKIHERKIPTERDILSLVGKKADLWEKLRDYLASHYPHTPEFSMGKKEHDWTFRYRLGGKTLVTLSPEENGFCVLVVLGKDEVERVTKEKNLLSSKVREIFETSKQFHDGRWLWMRPKTKAELESIKKILAIKRKPRTDAL